MNSWHIKLVWNQCIQSFHVETAYLNYKTYFHFVYDKLSANNRFMSLL